MTSKRFDSIRLKAVCIALVAAYPLLAEAGVAGRVQFVAGDVRIVDDKGAPRPMRKGDDINEGDTVLSGADGSAQVRMIDGAIVAVRPRTELKVIDYAFDEKDSSKENASFSLAKGGLRAITGLIGKVNKDRYKLATPTATIGIRGTDHEPVVVLPGAEGAEAGAPPGTYDKVNVGATSLTTMAGTTVIAANQVGFAAAPNQPPVILPKIPDFYRAAPAPKQQAQQQEQEKAAEGGSAGSGTESSSESTASAPSSESKTVAKAATASAIATAPSAASLTAVDAGGNTLNLAQQTLVTSGGKSVVIGGDVPTTEPQTPVVGTHEEVIAVYPAEIAGSGGQNFSYPQVYMFGGQSQSITRDAAGNIVAVTAGDGEFRDYRSSLTQTGATMTDLGTHAASGLSWGRWQGGKVTQTAQYQGVDASGKWGMGAYNDNGDFVIGATQTTQSSATNGSLHWIAGKSPTPEYLTRVLTGSASYTLVGGTRPTDQNGNLGTLNNASLGVNFSTQMVNAAVNFTIGGNTWALESSDMALLGGPHFSSYNWCAETCSSNTVLTKNGAPVGGSASASGTFGLASMNGSLLGTGLNSAALQYAVQETVPTTTASGTSFTQTTMQGVAAFTGPTQDVQTPFRMVGTADGWNIGMDYVNGIEIAAAGAFRGSMDGGESPASRVVESGGALTEFVGSAYGYTPAGVVPTADGDVPATIRIGTAVNRDVGSTTIGGTTVSWGRWEGGSINIYSRDGSVRLGTVDNSGRSVHWVASSVLTGSSSLTSLPLTGTATYSVAGHTNPTDFLGNTGTLNSATLTADFANAKVNAGVNVSFSSPTNTGTWTMTANNVPLHGKDGFGSSTAMNGVGGIAHTAGCAGAACGSQTIGSIDGIFFGSGQGAAMRYGMATGTMSAGPDGSTPGFAPSNAVTGMVIMKR